MLRVFVQENYGSVFQSKGLTEVASAMTAPDDSTTCITQSLNCQAADEIWAEYPQIEAGLQVKSIEELCKTTMS